MYTGDIVCDADVVLCFYTIYTKTQVRCFLVCLLFCYYLDLFIICCVFIINIVVLLSGLFCEREMSFKLRNVKR